MTYPVRWTRRSVQRLDQIVAPLVLDSPAQAVRLLTRIVSAIDLLAEHPAMGRPGRIRATRELVLADIRYIVAYRIAAEAIEIVTILHSSQKWPDRL